MPRGKRTRSPSISAPAPRNSSIASGASRKSIPTCSRIVSAFSSSSASPSSETTSTGASVRVRNGTLSTTALQPRRLPRRAPSRTASAASRSRDPPLTTTCGTLLRCSSARGKPNRPRQPRVRVDVVRDRHRVARSAPGSAARPRSRPSRPGARPPRSRFARPVEERDPRTCPGGVPRGRDLLRIAVGHEPEDERVNGVDVRSERSREPDPVDASRSRTAPSAVAQPA